MGNWQNRNATIEILIEACVRGGLGRYFKGAAFEKGLQLLIAGQKFSLRKKNELTHLNIIANQLSGPPFPASTH